MPILPTAQLLKALISDPGRSKSVMRNPEAPNAFSELLMRSPQARDALSELLMRSPQAPNAFPELLVQSPQSRSAITELLTQSPQARGPITELLTQSPQARGAITELLTQSPQARGPITELLMHSPQASKAFLESEPGKEPDQKKEHAGEEKVMSASEPRGLMLRATKSRPAPDSPQSRQTYATALRSALRGWDIKGSGPAHWQCSRGKDRLVDEGERVRAKQGSPAEVEGMFAVARAKGWQPWRSAAARPSNGR